MNRNHQLRAGIVGCLTWLLLPAAAWAEFQTFENAASAAADGWTTAGGGAGETLGFINDNLAGGAAGEAQFAATRHTASRYYADVTLDGPVTFDDPFQFTGKVHVGSPADTGSRRYLGFFDTSNVATYNSSILAGVMLHDSAFGGITGVEIKNGTATTFSTLNLFLNNDTTYDLSVLWDPDGGTGNGKLTATFIGAGGGVAELSLTAGNRATLNGLSMDAFGFVALEGGSAIEPAGDARLDNANYLLPEPSAAALAALAIGGLPLLMKRRRFTMTTR